MRSATLLVLALGLPAVEDPAAWLPEQATIEIRVPDLARSQQRWATTPYRALLSATPWGQVTVGELRTQLEAAMPGACAAVETLRSAAGTVTMVDGRSRLGLAAVGSPAHMRLALGGLGLPAGDGEADVGDGRLAVSGPVIAWVAKAEQPLAARAMPPGFAPAADLGLRFNLRETAGPALPAEVRVAISFDKVGLHEVVSVPASPAGAAAAQALTRWADPEELGSLPAATLSAVTWRADAGAMTALLKTAGLDPVLAPAERALAKLGLPGLRETLVACNGSCSAWIAEATPFPTLGAALSMPEPMAKRWIAAAAAQLNLVAGAEGAQVGFVGLVQVTVGWTDGRLVATTDPAGLDAWRRRKPGFAEHPEVRDAIAGMPARCVLLGAGRGGASWVPFAQLAVPLFAGMGNPQVVALPNDLRAAGGRGWSYLSVAADGSAVLDSGGLFGGPCAVALLAGSAIPAVLWVQHQQHEILKQQAPQALPVPTEPPVF